MKKDIESREDIRKLIDAFYAKVRQDDVIGPIFNEVAKVNWEHHLPVMVDFWENVLFQTGNYSGNPMLTHIHLNKISPLKKFHFDRWIQLFSETIDEHFEGLHAETARQRGMSIANLLQIRIATNLKDEL